MPAILTLTLIVVLVLVVVLFVRDAKQAQQRHAGTQQESGASDVVSHHEAPALPDTPAALDASAIDREGLAEHVRGLRDAVDAGLIGREEAVDSIIRQSGGGIGTEAAAQLLDVADEAPEPDSERRPGGESGPE